MMNINTTFAMEVLFEVWSSSTYMPQKASFFHEKNPLEVRNKE